MTENQQGWGEEMDPKAHLSTYESFIAVSKWGMGLIALTLILMAVFLL